MMNMLNLVIDKLRIIHSNIESFVCHIRRAKSSFYYSKDRRLEIDPIEIAAFRNKHQGERCFIICNGPSLKSRDLDVIHKNRDVTFACNKIDRIFEKTEWRPTYYVVDDVGLQFRLYDSMKKMQDCEGIFIPNESYYLTKKLRNAHWFNPIRSRSLLDEPKFTDDCSYYLYTLSTVTYVMVELAVHMGFKKIYIIGCDNSYGKELLKDGTVVEKNKKSYFEGAKQRDQNKAVGVIWELNIAYDFLNKWASENGIYIYNATRGGHLDAFERVDFDQLFQPSKTKF